MGFSARPYRLALCKPYNWAKGAHGHRAGLIVRLDLDGALGWGEVAFDPHVPIDGARLRAEVMALVEGLDPAAEDFLAALDRRKPHERIRAAIACAWFSARAAQAGEPLGRHLARRNALPRAPAASVPINGLVGDPTVEGALAEAEELLGRGMQTLKIKCFDDLERDLARVAAIRAAFPEAGLRLDPNDAWKDVAQSRRALERFEPFGIAYVEDPLDTRTASVADMARLRALSPIPLAWDNPVGSIEDMRRLVEAGAVDVFIFKMPRSGGPDRQLAMCDFAARHGIPFVMTSPLETTIGAVAGLHVTSLSPPPIADSGFSLTALFERNPAAPPAVVDGRCAVPTGPGLGVAPAGTWRDDPIE